MPTSMTATATSLLALVFGATARARRQLEHRRRNGEEAATSSGRLVLSAPLPRGSGAPGVLVLALSRTAPDVVASRELE
jgi:hypothetical protein